MLLLHPKRHRRFYPDDRSRESMRKTLAQYEQCGPRCLKQGDYDRTRYAGSLESVRRERLFATLRT